MLPCTAAIVLAAAMTPPCNYVGLTSNPHLKPWVGSWCEIEVHYNYTNNHAVVFGGNSMDKVTAKCLGMTLEAYSKYGTHGLGQRCFLAVAAYHVGLARYEKYGAVRAIGLAAMQNKWHAKYCSQIIEKN